MLLPWRSNFWQLLLVLLISFICLFNRIDCDKNKERTYVNLENPVSCVRRFNATHQIGCSKQDIGDYDGVIYVVRNQFELDRLNVIEQQLVAANDKKLTLVAFPAMYQPSIEFYKKKPSLFNGIVLLTNLDNQKQQQQQQQQSDDELTFNFSSPSNYSSDAASPNYAFSFYKNQKTTIGKVYDWNTPAGTSNMFVNFDVPFYLITSIKDVKSIVDDCYEKFNRQIFVRADGSDGGSKFAFGSTDLLCGVRMGLEMSGAVSSSVCIRRSNILHTLDGNSFCDPMGGSNYFTFLSQKPSNDLPIVMASVRIDSFTMFEYYTPAASQPISSIIGMLSLAELLSNHRGEFGSKFNILFTLFDNEAFDYGGSSRFVNDLVLDQFPAFNLDTPNGPQSFKLKKNNISTLIELGQLGQIGLSVNDRLFVHRDPITYGQNQTIKDLVDTIESKLRNYSGQSIQPVSNINQQLPPSSLQSFLKGGMSLAGVFVTDHERTFTNNFYHSVFDTPENMNVTYPSGNFSEAENYTTLFAARLQPMMTSVAQTIYALYSDSAPAMLNDSVSLSTLNSLVYCFYQNTTCSYLKGIMSATQWTTYKSSLDSTLPKQRLSFYTGVNDNRISGKWLTNVLMRYYTRNKLFDNLNSSECDKDSLAAKKLLNQTGISIRSFVFVENYQNVASRSLCIASAVYAVSSVSPAFANSDDGLLVNTDRFSAWAESSWSGEENDMRLFLFPTVFTKYFTFGLGLGVFVLSIILTWLADKNSTKFFNFNHPEQSTDEIIEQQS